MVHVRAIQGVQCIPGQINATTSLHSLRFLSPQLEELDVMNARPAQICTKNSIVVVVKVSLHLFLCESFVSLEIHLLRIDRCLMLFFLTNLMWHRLQELRPVERVVTAVITQ